MRGFKPQTNAKSFISYGILTIIHIKSFTELIVTEIIFTSTEIPPEYKHNNTHFHTQTHISLCPLHTLAVTLPFN